MEIATPGERVEAWDVQKHDLSQKSKTIYCTGLTAGLSVMRSFSSHGGELTLGEISEAIAVPAVNVRRSLRALKVLGYVETTSGCYSLTPQVLTLLQAYQSSDDLGRCVQPYIEKLTKIVGAASAVSILMGDEIIYVARAISVSASPANRNIGEKFSAFSTAMGRVLLASLSDATLGIYLERLHQHGNHDNDGLDESSIKAYFHEIRAAEFCVLDTDGGQDLRAIAVPIRNLKNNIIAAAHVCAELRRFSNEQMRTEVLFELQNVVSQIQALLF
jgi:IclR family pca regulon transcriptional regulator